MFFYNDTLIIHQTTLDLVTGEKVRKEGYFVKARIQQSYKRYRTFNGDFVNTNFIVYLPPETHLQLNDELEIDGKFYTILEYAAEKDCFGKVSYIKAIV